MGLHTGPPEIVLLLVVVALILGRRRLRHFGMRNDEIDRLSAELGHGMSVYSAETTTGKEAEFIRDRLPKRFPYWLVLIGVLAVGAALWWLRHR